MGKQSVFPGMVVLVVLAFGCSPEPSSSAGLRLPEGDPDAGQVAFVTLQCNSCHTVAGVDMARPVADPPVGVDLAVVSRRLTHGEMVTAIIHPDHEISVRFASGRLETGGHSRMADYSDLMTVRQLVDIVAFLQARHVVIESRTEP